MSRNPLVVLAPLAATLAVAGAAYAVVHDPVAPSLPGPAPVSPVMEDDGDPVAHPVGEPVAQPGPAEQPAPVQPDTAKEPVPSTEVGYIRALVRHGDALVLTWDRAEMLTGVEAAEEYAQDGLEPLDWYVRNDNPRLREYDVVQEVEVVASQLLGGAPEPREIDLTGLGRYLDGHDTSSYPLFELERDAQGQVLRIAEVYLP